MLKSSILHLCTVKYFISGHLTLTEAEFDEYYRSVIDQALARGDSFFVGDARGAETRVQNYLLGKTDGVVVYHMFTSLRNNAGFKTKGGFNTNEERDRQMTTDSDYKATIESFKKVVGDFLSSQVSTVPRNPAKAPISLFLTRLHQAREAHLALDGYLGVYILMVDLAVLDQLFIINPLGYR